MNVNDAIYSLDEVEDLSDENIYQLLYECWHITNGKIEVWGEIRVPQNDKWAGIFRVNTLNENRETLLSNKGPAKC
jgi:homoserine trans-succinylase